MSTRVDILAAKAEFNDHQAAHKCVPAYLRPDTVAQCPLRVKLWLAYMDTARLWGIEPGDKAKVTEQYAWQTALLGQNVMAG
jgi:hypothetical protein